MNFSALAVTLILGSAQAISTYQQVGNYSGFDFFDHWDIFSAPDPTSGFVKYVDLDTANSTGLAGFVATEQYGHLAYLGTDYSSVAQGGRPSTRIESIDSFNSSTLWIADIRHSPGGVCGCWSAVWLVGPKWPSGGEIDLRENINLASTNKYVLHTGNPLVVSNFSDPNVSKGTGMNMRGHFSSLNCTVDDENIGCAVEGQNGTFGTGFNANGGGIIALEFLSEAISVWQFDRTEIPGDIFNAMPEPSTWRTPDAHFMSDDGEPLDEYFNSLRMVFNTDICGSWIDAGWSTSECAYLAPTCAQYAAQNSTTFKDAYFLIGGVQIYRSVASGMNSTMLPPFPAMNISNTRSMKHRNHIRRTHPRSW